MTTLHSDHRMNLPCDTVVLMVITCTLIYVIKYCIRAYELLLYPVHVPYT